MVRNRQLRLHFGSYSRQTKVAGIITKISVNFEHSNPLYLAEVTVFEILYGKKTFSIAQFETFQLRNESFDN